MSKIKELRQRKADLVREGSAIVAAAEGGVLTDAQVEQYEAVKKNLEQVNRSLGVAEAQADLERELAPVADRVADAAPAIAGSEKKFRSFGEQMAAVMLAALPDRARVDPRLTMFAGTPSGANEGINSDGGFLVQTDFSSELLRQVYEGGEISSRIRRIPVGAAANGLKINGVDETSRATGSRWGGIRAFWEGEADQYQATKPKFRRVELNLKKLTGLAYATEELLQDTVALGAILEEAFKEEFSWLVEDAIVNGTGVGMPLGYMNSGALVTVPKEGGQAAPLEAKNISKMWARMPAKSRANAVWLINQELEPELDTMTVGAGGNSTPVYMPPGGLSASPYGTLKGRPVLPVEYAAAPGAVGDIQLVDLSQYMAIDKGSIQSASSIHVRFIYDETAFRFTYRVDGQPTWHQPVTPANGTAKLSPFIALEAR